MNLAQFHNHLVCNDCEFMNLTTPDDRGHHKHAVYKHNENNRKISILKNGELKPEYVEGICNWLSIPIPKFGYGVC